MIRSADLVQYALKAVGGGYIYGSRGQLCTRKLREDCAKANPSQAHNILVVGEKWDGKYVWDCSGIMRGAWRALLYPRSGYTTIIYQDWCSRKGTIDTMPDEPGTFVCRGTPDDIHHIGVYVGNGMVVDARGTKEGVLYGTLESYKAGWTHWCQADDVVFGDIPAVIVDERQALWTGTVKTRTGGGISLWTDSGKRAAVCNVPDGVALDVLDDADAKGFALCRYGTHTGMADMQYVFPADGEEDQGVIYRAQLVGVNIGMNLRSAPAKVENTILLIPPNAVVEVFAGAEEKGFAKVRHEGITGYCTASYLRKIETEMSERQ